MILKFWLDSCDEQVEDNIWYENCAVLRCRFPTVDFPTRGQSDRCRVIWLLQVVLAIVLIILICLDVYLAMVCGRYEWKEIWMVLCCFVWDCKNFCVFWIALKLAYFCIRYRNSKVFLSFLRARAVLQFSWRSTYCMYRVSWFSKKDRLDLHPTRFSQGRLGISTTQQLRVSLIVPNLIRLVLILQVVQE